MRATLAMLILSLAAWPTAARAGEGGFALVELFTSEGRQARAAVAWALQTPVKPLRLLVVIEEDGIKVTTQPAADWVALVQDGLVSAVARGENSGKVLRHDAVVRRLVRLDSSGTGLLRPPADLDPKKAALLAWVQPEVGGPVLAGGRAPFPPVADESVAGPTPPARSTVKPAAD